MATRFFSAWEKEDTLYLGDSNMTAPDESLIVKKLPMLRQGKLAIVDFVPDVKYGITGPCGIFAISVWPTDDSHPDCEACANDYHHLLHKTLLLTLAEACSEYLDSLLRKAIHRNDIKIVKPAAGYSCCPDHSLKKDILALLPDSNRLGIRLTETFSMIPDASICGFIFAHPNASYPDIRKISKSQYDSYAKARGMNEEQAKTLLGNLLANED